MITLPDYRQDPWRAAIRQAAELCDELVVVYGHKSDKKLLVEEFGQVGMVKDGMSDDFILTVNDKHVRCSYLDWPQPEWSYDQLARHLNHALSKVKNRPEQLDPDWIVKFDSDYIFHEKDVKDLRAKMESYLKDDDAWCLSIEKKQFFMPTMYYEKGKVPIVIRGTKPIWYGKIKQRYSDLCQPIWWDGASYMKFKNAEHEIPEGDHIPVRKIKPIGGHFYNYDYTFKSVERAKELLYHFDRSHAKFWGKGYSGLGLEDITINTAFKDYLALLKGRIQKCNKKCAIADHPRAIQADIADLQPDQLGYNMWGLINIPKL